MPAERPLKIAAEVTINKDLSILPELDRWTLAELHEFADDGFCGEGQDFLVQDSRVVYTDVEDFEIDRKAFAQYVEWREANGLVDRDAVAALDKAAAEAGATTEGEQHA